MRGSFRAHPTAPSPADAHAGISPVFLKLLADEPLEGRTVLDVGTGRGRLALTLAPRCGRVVGIDRDETRAGLEGAGFAIEHLSVERDVQAFGSVEEALAASIGLEEKWRADGRWFRYIKFLEDGGRTLTRAHLHVKARKK